VIPQQQKIVDPKVGDCFRACIASILELPNDERLPHIDSSHWHLDWLRFLEPFGLQLEFDFKKIWREGYWIATVNSLNYENGAHAIVMEGPKVAFDPSLKSTYKIGRSLLGEPCVLGGWCITVTDASKIHKLKEYRDSLDTASEAAV